MIYGLITQNWKKNKGQKTPAEKYMKELFQMYHLLKKKNIGEGTSIYGLIMHYMKNAFVIIFKLQKKFIRMFLI